MQLPQWEEHFLAAASSCRNREARDLTAQGWQALLMADDELARALFSAALEKDAEAMMPRCGLLLSGDRSQSAAMEEQLQEAHLNPAEVFYVETFLKLLENDLEGAAQDFTQRAQQYRADFFAGYWGILLNHYSGHDDRAMELWKQMIARAPEDAALLYLRALLEESQKGSNISDEALQSVKRCIELQPASAAATCLYGHLLFRSGKIEQSAPVFEAAQRKADGVLFYAAALYRATALWCAGQDQASLDLRRELNAAMKLTAAPQNDAEALWRWEVNTLPLRILVRRKELPTAAEIRLAVKAATPEHSWPGDECVLLCRDTLALLLRARQQHNTALVTQAAEKYKEFVAKGENVQGTPFYRSCYLRAKTGLEIALNAVRAEVFSDKTKDVWESNVQELEQSPAKRLLPPIIPSR